MGDMRTTLWSGYRCSLNTPLLPRDIRLCLAEGDPVEPGAWSGSYEAVADEPGPLEDMPWCDMDIVSDRFKELLCAIAPGCAQFLPMHVRDYRGRTARQMYWVVNWLRIVDCIDMTHTDVMYVPKGDPIYVSIAINCAKVPADEHVFRFKNAEHYVAISDHLRAPITMRS